MADQRGSEALARERAELADAELRARIRTELRAVRPGKLPADWPDEAGYRDDLGLDSLDFVEMVARLEQLTGLYVPDADLPRLTSVATTLEYLRERRGDPAGRP